MFCSGGLFCCILVLLTLLHNTNLFVSIMLATSVIAILVFCQTSTKQCVLTSTSAIQIMVGVVNTRALILTAHTDASVRKATSWIPRKYKYRYVCMTSSSQLENEATWTDETESNCTFAVTVSLLNLNCGIEPIL